MSRATLVTEAASAIPTPASGSATMFVDTADGLLKLKNSAGAVGGVTVLAMALYQDQKTTSTTGQNVTSGAWRTRDLTTEVMDPLGIGSLASNQVTLAAGTYLVYGCVALYSHNETQLRIQDVTNTATLGVGISFFVYNVQQVGGQQEVFAYFTLAGTAAIELQHQVAAAAVAVAAGFTTEVYAQLLVIKLGV